MVFSIGCPREEGYLLIIIGVILGIVAIGAALLLIWKLLATIQVIYRSLKVIYAKGGLTFIITSQMDDSSYRLNFDLDKKNEIHHYS